MLLVLLLCAAGAVRSDDSCLSDDPEPNLYFSTKTPYEVVRDKSVHVKEVPECEPVMLWALIRHGTRYPKAKEIKRHMELSYMRDSTVKNHESSLHRGTLCYEDLNLLKEWKYNISLEQAEEITQSGSEELNYLARRLKSRFPQLLSSSYSRDYFKIRMSEKVRTKESAAAFTYGLFGHSIDLPDSFEDDLLVGNDNCTRWKDSTKSDAACKEAQLFEEGPLVQDLLVQVSKRLGFEYTLNLETILDLYDVCRYQKAWYYRDISPWCVAFSRRDIEILEYHQDLRYYYHSGYGNSLTSKFGCPLVKDLISTFNNFTLHNGTGPEQPRVVLNFGHSVNLRAFLVGLGIARDRGNEPIRHDNFPLNSKRQWRTSVLSPFTGNLVAVLFRCSSGEEYRVMFYIQERYVDYEGCQVGLCGWSYIWDRFEPFVTADTCSRRFCTEPSSATSATHLGLTALVVMTLLLVSVR